DEKKRSWKLERQSDLLWTTLRELIDSKDRLIPDILIDDVQRVVETDIQEKDKNKAKKDKTEHGKNVSKSQQSKSKSTPKMPNHKVVY
ncbi:hypothetical protein Tco_1349808, partial [Tanacetum coccineum]